MAKQEMQSSSLSGNKPTASTQSYLDVQEIKESTIVMRDGSLRAVIAVSSTNFSLKSAEEQNALIGTYQNFLNALEFPIQILMQSRKLDINTYLDKLRGIMQQQTNELLRMQTAEYVEYIEKLIEFASIMNKTFYVVIPLGTAAIKKGLLEKFANLLNPAKEISVKSRDFEKAREELLKRVNQVTGGLGQMGLKSISLNTEELLELIYNSYNMDTASPIKIKSIDELDITKTE
jgi:type IV secretory pathway VirB4 component